MLRKWGMIRNDSDRRSLTCLEARACEVLNRTTSHSTLSPLCTLLSKLRVTLAVKPLSDDSNTNISSFNQGDAKYQHVSHQLTHTGSFSIQCDSTCTIGDRTPCHGQPMTSKNKAGEKKKRQQPCSARKKQSTRSPFRLHIHTRSKRL